MGLKAITAVRQFTTFTPEGKVQKIYEISFTTEKTVGEFSFEMPVEEYTAANARKLATDKANEIDQAVG